MEFKIFDMLGHRFVDVWAIICIENRMSKSAFRDIWAARSDIFLTAWKTSQVKICHKMHKWSYIFLNNILNNIIKKKKMRLSPFYEEATL